MRQRSGARELGLIVSALAVCAHFLEPRYAAVIAVLAGIAVAAGVAQLIGRWSPFREPLYPLALPMVAVFAVAGVARLVGPALWLVAILPAGWLLVVWVVDLELFGFFQPPPTERTPDPALKPIRRIRTRRRPESELPELIVEETIAEPETPPHPRALAIRSTALGMAFLAFVAVGGFVTGALGEVGQKLSGRHLVELLILNAGVAGAVGYRLSALVAPAGRDRMLRLLAFIEYATPAAVGTVVFRTMSLPRLFVPALLTLILYIVTILRESPEPVLMNRRLLQELAVLALVGAVTVAWGLLAR